MARPRSVKSVFGKRPTSTSVRPLLTALLTIAAARFIRSSSDTPECAFSLSSRAFFSASTSACLRIYSEAFSASAMAILLLQSAAVGRRSSAFAIIAHPPKDRTGSVACAIHQTHLNLFLENHNTASFDLGQEGSPLS